MRIIAILAILSLSACTVAGSTKRHSGVGFSNTANPTAGPTAPAAENDYRGKLMEDLAAG